MKCRKNKKHIVSKLLLASFLVQNNNSECFFSYAKSISKSCTNYIKNTFKKDNIANASMKVLNVMEKGVGIIETIDTHMIDIFTKMSTAKDQDLKLNLSSYLDSENLIRPVVEVCESHINKYLDFYMEQYKVNILNPLQQLKNLLNLINLSSKNIRDLLYQGAKKLFNSLDAQNVLNLLIDDMDTNYSILYTLDDQKVENVLKLTDNKKIISVINDCRDYNNDVFQII